MDFFETKHDGVIMKTMIKNKFYVLSQLKSFSTNYCTKNAETINHFACIHKLCVPNEENLLKTDYYRHSISFVNGVE